MPESSLRRSTELYWADWVGSSAMVTPVNSLYLASSASTMAASVLCQEPIVSVAPWARTVSGAIAAMPYLAEALYQELPTAPQ